MSARRLGIALGLLALVVALSAVRFPGALIGFVVGVAVAFSLAPLAALLAHGLAASGLSLPVRPVVAVAALAWCLSALVLARRALALRRAGDLDRARLEAFRLAVVAALPAIALLSTRTLLANWPM